MHQKVLSQHPVEIRAQKRTSISSLLCFVLGRSFGKKTTIPATVMTDDRVYHGVILEKKIDY